MSEWKERRLEDVVQLKRGFDLPTRDRRPGPFPVVGSAGISGWHDEGPVLGPALVLGRAGSSMGVASYYETERFWPLNTSLFVEDFKGNEPRFIFHLFQLTDLTGYNSGSAQPMLNRNYIRDVVFLIPSTEKQRAISDVLKALDDKIAVNDRIARKSREMITLKYEESVASGVKSARIGEIAELFDGPHATPEKTESGPWFLSISSLSGGRLLLGESAHLSEDDFARWTRRVTPKPGDVLFSYETRLGDAALMPAGIRACLGRRMALLRPRDVGSRTLLQAFLAPSFQETIRKYAIHGATVERISLTDFPSWLIELPAQEQNQSESIFAKFDDLAQESERENETLTALRDALLPKLMSGQIRVRDAVKVVEDVT